MLALCRVPPDLAGGEIYAVLLVGGFFRSLQFTAYNTLAYGDVPRSRMSAATSLYVTGQQLAATIGMSVGRAGAGGGDRCRATSRRGKSISALRRSWWWRASRWPRDRLRVDAARRRGMT